MAVAVPVRQPVAVAIDVDAVDQPELERLLGGEEPVALEHGAWLRPLGNVLVILPPLAISLEELDRICLAVEAGIRETL